MRWFQETAAWPLITLAGLGVGWLLVRLYNRLPESWLQDYGFRPNDPDWPPARRVRSNHVVAGVMLMTGAGFLLSVLTAGLSIRALLLMLVLCILVLVALPDALNKIIPDQSVVALSILGAAFAAHDLFMGRGVREVAWDRVGGAVVAAVALWLIGTVASMLAKREAMGMGDVKLLFACGFLTGLHLLPLLFFVSFVSAAFLAIPMLIRQRRHTTESEEAGQAPLGPFISAACFLCLTVGDSITHFLFSGLL